MDYSEIIALAIVALAALLLVRHLFVRRHKPCCKQGCAKPPEQTFKV